MTEKKPPEYQPIGNYGIIGNLNTVALVSKDASIDYLCLSRFDSPTVFASLLDSRKGGFFKISPTLPECNCNQFYIPDTAILISRMLAHNGIAEITDFMPVVDGHDATIILRRVIAIRSTIQFEAICCPRFDYARTKHRVTEVENGIAFEADHGGESAWLYSTQPLTIQDSNATANFELAEGESAWFLFTNGKEVFQKDETIDTIFRKEIKASKKFWENWICKSTYKGNWREAVHRSAITLKLLTSLRYGSVIAAGTFGLPEAIGEQRNWDYRYTWIRDASFTMYIFLKLGMKEEAEHFLNWLKKECASRPMQLMYAIDGKTDLIETELSHLEGYRRSKPVRIGNAAHEQLQLDIYGELMDTIYLFNRHSNAITYQFWQEVTEQIEFVLAHWKEADHGIWEIRNEKHHYLYSRLMCWVAIDRAIKIAEDRSFPYPLELWHNERNEMYKSIFEDFWSEEKQSFVQHPGSSIIDASVLMMPLRRFISPKEDKWIKTMHAINKELRTDVFVYRYNNEMEDVDGMGSVEGSFTMCSFWYAECLVKCDHVAEAKDFFERMLTFGNHLGLYAEELGSNGEHLGNFPQAFTHLGLISAALELDKRMSSTRASGD